MTEEKKIFLCDIDNACLAWTEAMFEFLKEKHPEIDTTNLNVNDYSFGLEQTVLDDLWKEFNKTSYFDDIKPLRDAATYVPLIAEKFDLIGITSCLPNNSPTVVKSTTARRKANLEKYFPGMFKDCICICIHNSKLPHLKSFSPTLWVDDKAHNVLQGIEAGHESFLMSFGYNNGDNIGSGTRVSGWKEIYEHTLK